jgi:hypothetical protein
MALFFLIAAFTATFLATYRSLGWGFAALLAVGYVNGVVRANYLSVYTTFMFDAAVLGLYLGFILTWSLSGPGAGGGAVAFVVFLITWPALLTGFPANHYLVQLVAMRATVWFLPVLLVATRLRAHDLTVLTRGLAVLNLVTLAAGVYLYRYGVEALYPMNAVTYIIYKSNDIAGFKYHRIPSTFLSAHAYGGTMVLTLPFLVDRLAGVGVRPLDRYLAMSGVIAAAGGLLMCGARSPVVLFLVTLLVAWPLSRFSLKVLAVMAVLIGGSLFVASGNERFQRASSVIDSEAVAGRVAMSANASFLQLLADYPMGAGMGSSVGTSIPYFLTDVAPEQIGLENEYCRILVDQGWIGLGGWLAFVGFLFIPPPRPWRRPWQLGVLLMYALCLATWLTAFIGTGLLAAVPCAVLLLTQMGLLAAVRERGAVPGTVPPRPARVRCTRGIPPGMVRGPGGCWLPATTAQGKQDSDQQSRDP